MPTRYGGLGADYQTYCLVAEQLARHEKLRAAKVREVIDDGVSHGQPDSEPVEQGSA